MSRFIFLTKTRWSEPPRIRHQIAQPLADAGHEVLFFEKPQPFWRSIPEPRNGAHRITLVGQRELLHHKLRIVPALHALNSRVVHASISEGLAALPHSDDAVIVNFNYDYCYLTDWFPRLPIVTIINDDFISSASFGITRPLSWALRRTCVASDSVLTVSMPLQRSLAAYAQAELFLPWADRAYDTPQPGRRDILLFWGFINRKIDFALTAAFADRLHQTNPAIQLLIAGPVEQGVNAELRALAQRPNVEVRPASALDELPLPRVLASIIPYKSGVEEIEAIMLPNKALQLLARGLPLVVAGMPHFIQAPFVFQMDSNVSRLIDRLVGEFDALQPDIRSFVADNAAAVRLGQFERIVDRARARRRGLSIQG